MNGNICIQKTNLKSKYSSIKIDDNKWITQPDKSFITKLTKDLSRNFMSMLDDERFEKELIKKYKLKMIADLRGYMMEYIYSKFEIRYDEDIIEKQTKKAFDMLADLNISVIFDATKRLLTSFAK